MLVAPVPRFALDPPCISEQTQGVAKSGLKKEAIGRLTPFAILNRDCCEGNGIFD